MADIRINALPEEDAPVATENVAIDGANTRRVTIQKLVDAGAPPASQAEAEAGVNAVKRMSPLTTKQAILANIGTSSGTIASGDDTRITGSAQKTENLSDLLDASAARTNLGLGTAATASASAFATASQGATADSAIQPSYLGFSDTDSDANVLARLPLQNLTHQPEQYSGILGSLGKGAIFREVTRTGGYGSYGDILVSGVVDAATVTTEIDVGITSWMTHKNLQGGQVFGGWDGANTPAAEFGTFTGGAAIGREINVGNRWGDTGKLTSTAVTRYTAGLQIVPDVAPTRDTVTYTATITAASPAVVTHNAHGLTANTPVRFQTTGVLPTGMTAGTVYFVDSVGLAANTFQLKTAIIGGSSVDTTDTGSGTHAYIPAFPSNFAQIIAQSIHGHRWWIGTLIAYDSLMPGGEGVHASGASASASYQPDAYLKMDGYWKRGLDFEGTVFSDAVFNFDFANQTAATATAGGLPSPGGFAGYIIAMVSGTLVKIPYFGN